ncbi:phage scaffolding protein [Mammaliicoccus sciuri]|uniref:phage scaffolding protein n=1 Tax=Mammaliicoccus sciuri TaxID=1296 RepID=UPI002DBA3DE1|nr:phage scaffolding protein [Mammaliicoccus sciuri]MEB8141606.1 phage scaffolding protein [Mammaliicoccus sciuri]
MEFKDLLKQFADGSADEQTVIEAYEKATEGMIPRSRLNDKNEDIKELQEQLAKRDEQIVELQKSVKDESEISKELEELKQSNAEWSEKYQQSQLNNAIKLAVAKDAINADHVLKLLDTDGLELQDDGSVKGLNEKLETFKNENTHLFGADKPSGKSPQDGNNPTGGITKEQFDQMGVSEREQLFVNDRKTYDQLIQN